MKDSMKSPAHRHTSPSQLRRGASVLLVMLLATCSAVSRGTAAGTAAKQPSSAAIQAPAPAKPSYRLEDSPGWYPKVDPESMSVVIGRRTNAPLVRTRFRDGATSLDELGRTACRLMDSRNADSLLAMCVRDSEFKDVMWPEFPQSRPATGLRWDDGWTPLTQRLISGCAAAVHDFGGKGFKFQNIKADSIARYKNFTLYSQIKLVAVNGEGKTEQMLWVRAIVERKGRFKIYSTDD